MIRVDREPMTGRYRIERVGVAGGFVAWFVTPEELRELVSLCTATLAREEQTEIRTLSAELRALKEGTR